MGLVRGPSAGGDPIPSAPPPGAFMFFEREGVARRLGSAWLRRTATSHTGEDEDAFVNSLVNEGSVALVGTWTLPLSGDVAYTASIVGQLSWIWPEGAPGDGGRAGCTSLRISVERMNVKVSKTEVPPSTESNDIQGDASTSSEEHENQDENKAAENDSTLSEWLSSISPVAEINVDMCIMRFDKAGKGLGESLSFLAEAAGTGVISLLSHCRGTDEEKNTIPPLRLAVKRINVIYDTNFRCQLSDYSHFGRGQKWSVGMMTVGIPLMTFQVDCQLTGMHTSHTEDGFHMSIKAIRQLNINGDGFALCLKFFLQRISLEYCHGELSVKLPQELALMKQPGSQQAFDSQQMPLPFPIHVDAHRITVEAATKEHFVSLESVTITLAPVSIVSSTALSVHAQKVELTEYLTLRSVSCGCSIDTKTRFADNLCASIDSASFEACTEGIAWLQTIIDYAERSDRPIAAPYAKISSIRVSFPKGVLHSDEAELASIDGEEDATFTSIVSLLATNLMNEAEGRRILRKEERAGLADSVAVSAGLLVGGVSMATPIGAAVGAGVAVASLSVRDTIGSAVLAGKESRGVTEHDSYVFGDFSRGVIVAGKEGCNKIESVIEAGKESRGATPHKESYRFGDLTRGIVASGKERRGASPHKESYRFGDFTRGLVSQFSSRRRNATEDKSTSYGDSLDTSDNIGTVIEAGKASRGASEDESYRFGDVSRGLVVAGKESRGVTGSDEYRVGDFSRGLTNQIASSGVSSSKPSILKDKQRLAGVGGMSAGAAVGTALLGPVGLVAGSYIGSRVAKASVRNDDCNDDGDDTQRRDVDFDSLEQMSSESEEFADILRGQEEELMALARGKV